jgi:hypothetical protein
MIAVVFIICPLEYAGKHFLRFLSISLMIFYKMQTKSLNVLEIIQNKGLTGSGFSRGHNTSAGMGSSGSIR